jgi:hypothetical protein
VKKCPLCDKKIPEDAKFCPHCGWDLTDHQLTPPQIARLQEEIVDAKLALTRLQIGSGQFTMAGLVFMTFSLLALREVIIVRMPWVMPAIAVAFWSVAVALSFLALRPSNRQYRLKMMLRSRQPSQ